MKSLIILFAALLTMSVTTAVHGQDARRIEIHVDERGYHPGSVPVREGERVVLVFRRTTDAGCGQEVVIPSRDIRRALPLDQPVEIALRTGDEERLTFTCGMGMYRGALVVD